VAAVTRRGNGTAPDVAELAARIAELERREAVRDRLFTRVVVRLAPAQWTEFRTLLVNQFGVTHADAEAFIEFLTERRL
jgi:hypothetical protein